jgi:transcriptional regulator with PAS, ATPase and Fis domain
LRPQDIELERIFLTSAGCAVNAALEAIAKALKEHREDKQAAARVLGIALSMLYVKLKKYQL